MHTNAKFPACCNDARDRDRKESLVVTKHGKMPSTPQKEISYILVMVGRGLHPELGTSGSEHRVRDSLIYVAVGLTLVVLLALYVSTIHDSGTYTSACATSPSKCTLTPRKYYYRRTRRRTQAVAHGALRWTAAQQAVSNSWQIFEGSAFLRYPSVRQTSRGSHRFGVLAAEIRSLSVRNDAARARPHAPRESMTFSERLQEIRTGFERPFCRNKPTIFDRLSYYGAFASLALYLQEN